MAHGDSYKAHIRRREREALRDLRAKKRARDNEQRARAMNRDSMRRGYRVVAWDDSYDG